MEIFEQIFGSRQQTDIDQRLEQMEDTYYTLQEVEKMQRYMSRLENVLSLSAVRLMGQVERNVGKDAHINTKRAELGRIMEDITKSGIAWERRIFNVADGRILPPEIKHRFYLINTEYETPINFENRKE